MTPTAPTPPASDLWADWLLHHRHGGDPQFRQHIQHAIERYRDRVLDAAHLAPHTTLLDVGAGDGLIAFGAIARIGPALRVILTDLSAPLLRHAEDLANQRGIRSQCTFLEGTAENLASIAGATIDTLTTRAVLAYVLDKRAAFREFFRVLKPGGRISLCEPISQDDAFEAAALTRLVATQQATPETEFLHLLQRWKSAQFPATERDISTNPLTNFSERDLLRLAREAGFTHLHLELHIDHFPARYTNWDTFLDIAPHPWSPTLRQVLSDRFSEPERQLFTQVMRPMIESGNHTTTETLAYLSADKPSP